MTYQRRLEHLVILLALVGLALVPQVLQPFQVFLLAEILLWAIFAQSFNLLFGYTGLLSLGQSAYFAVGAYTVALLLRHLSPGLGWMILGGIVLSTLAAAWIGILAVRVRGHGFIIITAVPTILFFLFGLDQSWLTGGDNGMNLLPPKLFGRWSFFDPSVSFYLVLPFFIVVMLAMRWLLGTPLGRAFQLVRENEARAEVLGYDVLQLKFVSFVIAGLLAGLAGSLYALVTAYVVPRLANWTVSADAIIWTLVGGAGTLLGPVVGTGLLLILRESLSDVWSYGYPLLLGLILIVIVRFAPRGIVGTLRLVISHQYSVISHQYSVFGDRGD
jgi:branched-chain amino acid transport system permease protein